MLMKHRLRASRTQRYALSDFLGALSLDLQTLREEGPSSEFTPRGPDHTTSPTVPWSNNCGGQELALLSNGLALGPYVRCVGPPAAQGLNKDSL